MVSVISGDESDHARAGGGNVSIGYNGLPGGPPIDALREPEWEWRRW